MAKNKRPRLKGKLGSKREALIAADKQLETVRKGKGKLKTRKKTLADKVADSSRVLPGRTYDFSYTQNREVSWLRFDDRVLDEACDPSVPLLERLSFCSIFGSNLDEWFMVRIGGLSDLATLKHQPVDNRSNQTPAEQIATVLDMLPAMLDKCDQTYLALEQELRDAGVERVTFDSLSDSDRAAVAKFYDTRISPIASPLIVDPRHPFPNLRNNMQYVTCSLDGPDEQGVLGVVEVPPTLPRTIELPSPDGVWRYILVEDAIRASLSAMFGDYQPTASAVVRVTRNADVDPDGEGVQEEEDYRQHMKKVLRKRLRLQPVRMEVAGSLPDDLMEFIREELHLTRQRIFHRTIPLELSYVFSLPSHVDAGLRMRLSYSPFEPQLSPMVEPGVPMRGQVEDHDILLFYPYESMKPLLDLLHEAAWDEACISIKITLYRVAKQSRLCESLIAAAENGKDVTVLMELRARFDEQNNIEWAERLESAGCTVIYGAEGYKCHSKICQVTYHDSDGISRITCLGTGNFNEKTARLYSDFMLLTAQEGIGEDGNAFFRNLSLGKLAGSYRYLGVAPVGLKPLIMAGIDHEIANARAGLPARVFLKMNSLTDRDVIDKIAEATQAGVNVEMVVRGIVCMRPGVEGKTDGLQVHQIVGRFLEHARVYAFGPDVDTLYLSSADMMTRNTEHRVEIAYPVLDDTCRQLVVEYMRTQMADNVKARLLTCDGTWDKVPIEEGAELVNSQEAFIKRAYNAANGIPVAPRVQVLPTELVEQEELAEALPDEELEVDVDDELVDEVEEELVEEIVEELAGQDVDESADAEPAEASVEAGAPDSAEEQDAEPAEAAPEAGAELAPDADAASAEQAEAEPAVDDASTVEQVAEKPAVEAEPTAEQAAAGEPVAEEQAEEAAELASAETQPADDATPAEGDNVTEPDAELPTSKAQPDADVEEAEPDAEPAAGIEAEAEPEAAREPTVEPEADSEPNVAEEVEAGAVEPPAAEPNAETSPEAQPEAAESVAAEQAPEPEPVAEPAVAAEPAPEGPSVEVADDPQLAQATLADAVEVLTKAAESPELAEQLEEAAALAEDLEATMQASEPTSLASDEEEDVPHVEAHVIEPETSTSTALATLAVRNPGRFKRGFALIMLGLKTLFRGVPKE